MNLIGINLIGINLVGPSGPASPYPRRRYRVADCSFCERFPKQGPAHDPSPRCESGGYPHCTCDTCF